ncbi:ester cyclase [Tropicimonas sp. TH_r6]|uniref:ester cyclase n=1 Tax=Tropicimonas sp. TH_r6 TaxID=3082085 RepID=UPI0029556676|nr:ester cyclase [Tropicimonas sp. TH_r6]MDV7141782.1 ester cyclase [Tropicimonas sp. TH_r6]
MSEKRDLIQAFYDKIWVAGEFEAAETFFDLDAEASGLMPELAIGAAEFHEFVAALLNQLDVRRVSLEKTVEKGDWISVMASFEAMVLATGQTISGSGVLMARIVDGKIEEAYNCMDFMSFFEKLGLLPEHSLELCLTGQRLG